MENTFGRRIKELRDAKNLTQRKLAELVAKGLPNNSEGRGFDFTYLSKIENERMVPPSAIVITQLAKVLGIDSHELLDLAGKVHPNIEATFKDNVYAKMVFRTAIEKDFSESDWKKLLEKVKELKNDK
jgi:transcriptional regulator with XRE-family HTH domain